MAVLKATVTVKGIRPLLWHHFGPDALPLEKREKTGVAGNDPAEWQRTVLMDKERRLYLDGSYIFGTIREGARHTKKGKGSIMPSVSATLQVLDDRVYTDRVVPANIEALQNAFDEVVYLDVRGVRNPSSKARNVRYRVAASSGWSCTFNIIWDATIVSRQEMQACIIDAGRFSGLGDGRGIGFGRFEVVSIEISDFKASA